MTAADVAPIAAWARKADREEMQACAGAGVEQCLQLGLEHSLRAWVIESGGLPLAACGDTMAAIGIGVPWMVTTNHIDSNRRGFMRASKAVMLEMLQRHQVMANYVDARNAAAIRWLEWLGATVDDPAPYGVAGLPFRKFTMIQE
jgi:hypothetical protein